jgi:hypothetical protein
MSENNPFTPPESDLRPPSKGHQFIQEFPRLPTPLFIGLGLMTLGLYVYAWIYTRNAMINRCVPDDKKIPEWLSNSAVALGVISFSMSAIGMMFPGTEIGIAMIDAQGIFALVSFAMTMVWLFTFRALLNQLTGAYPGKRLWTNGVLLVLFSVYYLQFKINQIHDIGESEIPRPPSDDDNQSGDDGEKPKQGYIEL